MYPRCSATLLVGALLALPACQTSASVPPVPAARELPRPERLPARARALLDERMQRHGAAMSDMLWAALFLDYPSAKEIAEEIATEPRLARPLERDASEANALFPDRFFDLQDDLVRAAGEVARAAEARDAARLADTMGRLSATCIHCHAAYLEGPEAAKP
jgi:hypothetical protein